VFVVLSNQAVVAERRYGHEFHLFVPRSLWSPETLAFSGGLRPFANRLPTNGLTTTENHRGDLLRGPGVKARRDVAVSVQRDADIGVTEAFLHHLRMDPAANARVARPWRR